MVDYLSTGTVARAAAVAAVIFSMASFEKLGKSDPRLEPKAQN